MPTSRRFRFHYIRPVRKVNARPLFFPRVSGILLRMKDRTAKIEYTLIRSARRSIGIEVTPDGAVVVRAPRMTPLRQIETLLEEKSAWIARARRKASVRSQAAAAAPLTAQELSALRAQAKAYLPGRAAYYAQCLGVDYGRITIRTQRTRWGSCSSRGDLSFNCLLMLTPPEVIDSVVAHELCHRRHMDHSPQFYAEVHRVYPDYDKWHGWLREHGPVLLARAAAATEA